MVKHFLKISCKKYLKIVPLVYFWNQYFGWRAFCNLNISLKIVRAFRERFGYSKTIWIWTGFLFEYLKHQTDERRELLELTDILVDGLFMYQLYKPNLPYKGSLNQRVIDVQDSLRSHGIIEYVIMKRVITLASVYS